MEEFQNDVESTTAGSSTAAVGRSAATKNSSFPVSAPAHADFSIPEEYKDRGWARFFDGKTGDELKAEVFRSYDNSQSLIGKKVEDYLGTTDIKNLENYEQIKEQLTKQIAPEFQTPEDIKEYNLKEVLSGAEMELPISDEVLGSMAEKFKELGINAEQGQAIFKEYLDLTAKDFEAVTNAEDLEKNINEMFNGNQQQRQAVESLIKEFLPEEDKRLIQAIVPNVVVEMFYKVAKGFVEKYDYKEGTGKDNPGSMKMSEADKEALYDKYYNELIALDSRPHTPEEREAALKRLQSVYR